MEKNVEDEMNTVTIQGFVGVMGLLTSVHSVKEWKITWKLIYSCRS